MSRGPGRIERKILDEIEKDKAPSPRSRSAGAVLIRTWHILCDCFPMDEQNYKPTNAQRKAVTRAMRTIVRKYPQFALTGGKGRKDLFLYEPGDPLSAIWAKLSVESREHVPRSTAEERLHSLEDGKGDSENVD